MSITNSWQRKDNDDNKCNMRDLKSELVDVARNNILALQNMPQHRGLVRINRILLLMVLLLMFVIFLLGFLVLPDKDMLENDKINQKTDATIYAISNPTLTDEINFLKGQFVGLVSGSIESKLRILEENIQMGRLSPSLGTIQDLKNDIKILQAYSAIPENKAIKSQLSNRVLREVSQLKDLIYLTLSSCGLIIAALGGIWIKNNYRLVYHESKAMLGRWHK